MVQKMVQADPPSIACVLGLKHVVVPNFIKISRKLHKKTRYTDERRNGSTENVRLIQKERLMWL